MKKVICLLLMLMLVSLTGCDKSNNDRIEISNNSDFSSSVIYSPEGYHLSEYEWETISDTERHLILTFTHQ